MTKEHILFLLKYKQFVVLYHPSEGYIGVTKIGEKMFVTSYYDDLKNPFEGRTHLFVGDDVSTLEDCSLHSTFDLPKKRYAVNQKVRVREDAEKWREILGYGESSNAKPGRFGIIESLESGRYWVDFDGNQALAPHEALDPVYEEKCSNCESLQITGQHSCEKQFDRDKWLEEGKANGMVKDGMIVV